MKKINYYSKKRKNMSFINMKNIFIYTIIYITN